MYAGRSLACILSLDATLSVPLLAKGRIVPWNYWPPAGISNACSVGWVRNGTFPHNSWRNRKRLLASFTPPWSWVKVNDLQYNLFCAKKPPTSTMQGLLGETHPTSQLPSRHKEKVSGARSACAKPSWQRVEDREGRRSWALSSGLDLIYWPAPAQKSEHCRNVSVWQMDSNSQICANCQTATTSHLPQTVKKVQMRKMRTKMSWKAMKVIRIISMLVTYYVEKTKMLVMLRE